MAYFFEFFKKYKFYFIFIILYFISFGFMLASNGLMWDDWTFLNYDFNILNQYYGGQGLVFYDWFYKNFWAIFGNHPVFLLKFLTFFTYLFISILFYKILKTIKEIDEADRVFLFLFFTFLPLNFVRYMANFYTFILSLFLFWTAFYLISIYLKNKKNILLRIFILFFFFLSYFLQSLLVFYYIVPIYIFYKEKVRINNIKKIYSYIFKYFDFVILPVVFFLIKNIYWKNYGWFLNYNHISFNIRTIIKIPINLFFALKNSFFEVFSLSFSEQFIYIFFFSIFLFIFFKKFNIFSQKDRQFNIKIDVIFLCIGILSFFLGALPYLFVSKIPYIYGYESRFQILLNCGFAFILVYILKIFFAFLEIKNKNIKYFIYILFLVSFIFLNIRVYFNFQKDWLKKISLIENFRNNEIIKNNDIFYIVDNTKLLNIFNDNPHYSIYSNIFRLLYNSDNKIAFDFDLLKLDYFNSEDVQKTRKYPSFAIKNLNFSSNRKYKIILNYGKYDILSNNKNVLFLLFSKNNSEKSKCLKNILRIDYEKV